MTLPSKLPCCSAMHTSELAFLSIPACLCLLGLMRLCMTACTIMAGDTSQATTSTIRFGKCRDIEEKTRQRLAGEVDINDLIDDPIAASDIAEADESDIELEEEEM